jgi:hypothetical protein
MPSYYKSRTSSFRPKPRYGGTGGGGQHKYNSYRPKTTATAKRNSYKPTPYKRKITKKAYSAPLKKARSAARSLAESTSRRAQMTALKKMKEMGTKVGKLIKQKGTQLALEAIFKTATK